MKMLSLFSGIGAFEEALKNMNLDYDLVNYCEINPYAAKAYSLIHNISQIKNLGDITKVDESKLNNFDLMTYGFPCQSYSMQGKRLGFDDPIKGDLFFESMRIVRHCKPKYLIAENVEGLLTHDEGQTYQTIINTLDYIGYNSYSKVLNTTHFEVPQLRKRLFIVSIRKDIKKGFKFPIGRMTSKGVKDILDYDPNRKKPKDTLIPYMNTKYFTHKYLNENGIIKLFDGCKEEYFTSSFSGNRIYSVVGVSPTLTTKNDAVYFEIGGHLNQRERFALQGFKKEYVNLLLENGISLSEINKMSGNSITVNVVKEILRNLLLADTMIQKQDLAIPQQQLSLII